MPNPCTKAVKMAIDIMHPSPVQESTDAMWEEKSKATNRAAVGLRPSLSSIVPKSKRYRFGSPLFFSCCCLNAFVSWFPSFSLVTLLVFLRVVFFTFTPPSSLSAAFLSLAEKKRKIGTNQKRSI